MEGENQQEQIVTEPTHEQIPNPLEGQQKPHFQATAQLTNEATINSFKSLLQMGVKHSDIVREALDRAFKDPEFENYLITHIKVKKQ